MFCKNCSTLFPEGTYVCPTCSTILVELNEEFSKALEYWQEGDIRALDILNSLSDGGYALASYLLGQMYDNGELLEEDSNLALHYYEKALAQGDIQAYAPIGSLFFTGRLGKSRRHEAYHYLINALRFYPNDVIAHYDIARCYAYGIGTDTNIQEAKEHFEICLAEKPDYAWYYHSYAMALEKFDSPKCIELYKKGSDLGMGDCSYRLGCIYHNGMRSIPKSFDNATYYYQLALRQLSDSDDPDDKEAYYLAYNGLNYLNAQHEIGEV